MELNLSISPVGEGVENKWHYSLNVDKNDVKIKDRWFYGAEDNLLFSHELGRTIMQFAR